MKTLAELIDQWLDEGRTVTLHKRDGGIDVDVDPDDEEDEDECTMSKPHKE